MVKLKRLKIEQFRNVAPGTELHFRDSLNVLLGKNGTGKTTLLNLIVAILSWNFKPLLGEPLSLEYELETPVGRMKIKLRNKRASPQRVPLPELDPIGEESFGVLPLDRDERYETSGQIVLSSPSWKRDRAWAFEGFKFIRLQAEGVSRWEIEGPYSIASADMLRNILGNLSFLAVEYGSDAQPEQLVLRSAAVGSVLTLRRFDESLGYLSHISRPEKAFSAHRMERESRNYTIDALDGGPKAMVKAIGWRLRHAADSDEISVEEDSEDAEFLERVVKLLGFKSGKIRLQLIARRVDPYEVIDFGNLRFDFMRRDRSIINHSLLSYGQKRLLSFYYYLACSPSCVVADELVNGMHHEWIEACMEDLGGRQSFLTSQNPLLLDYLSFDSAEEVRSSFVLCSSEASGEREQLSWANMTSQDAEGFFAAYQVGIQHVSEILRTRGLW